MNLHSTESPASTEGPIRGNMTSTTKPEVAYITNCNATGGRLRQPPQRATCTENSVKFGCLVLEMFAGSRTDKQTYRHVHYNTPLISTNLSRKYRLRRAEVFGAVWRGDHSEALPSQKQDNCREQTSPQVRRLARRSRVTHAISQLE